MYDTSDDARLRNEFCCDCRYRECARPLAAGAFALCHLLQLLGSVLVAAATGRHDLHAKAPFMTPLLDCSKMAGIVVTAAVPDRVQDVHT